MDDIGTIFADENIDTTSEEVRQLLRGIDNDPDTDQQCHNCNQSRMKHIITSLRKPLFKTNNSNHRSPKKDATQNQIRKTKRGRNKNTEVDIPVVSRFFFEIVFSLSICWMSSNSVFILCLPLSRSHLYR